MLKFGHLSGRGGGLPDSKTFEDLFCLRLDIFQEKGGGVPDSKDDEDHFCFYLDIFQVKFGGITKVQTLKGTEVRIKSRFEKSSLKDSKKQRGGGQGEIEKNQTEADFFLWMASLRTLVCICLEQPLVLPGSA